MQLPQPLGNGDQPVDGEAGDGEAPLPANSWLEQVSEVVVYQGHFTPNVHVYQQWIVRGWG